MDVELVWSPPPEGSGDETETDRAVWEDEKLYKHSYGKEATFLVEEPGHALY